MLLALISANIQAVTPKLTANASVEFSCPLFPFQFRQPLCMEFIRISEMLDTMDLKGEDQSPIPFDFTYDTCNVEKETGGKRITMKNVVIVGGVISKSTKRNPNHFENYTRNYRSVNNQEIRGFHPLLVETFNGMKVTL